MKRKHKVKNLAKHSPSAFWKYIKKQNNKNEVDGPSADEFIKDYSKLSTDLHVNHHEYADHDIEINELDCKITTDEVTIAIKSLDRGKSYGLDNLIDEMFIDGIHVLSPLLVNIFNYIFESGTYPQEWLKGIIVPIPRKGYLTDANNYRGITIMSVFAKLFSIILNNRLVKFAENSSQFNDFQYGFREKRSTTDCIFILHNMIKCTLDKKKKTILYICGFQSSN